MKTDLYIEFNGFKINYKNLIDTTKEMWKSEGKKIKELDSMELFFKPEERKCYYVLNGDEHGYFEV